MNVELTEQDMRLINLALICMKSVLTSDLRALQANGLSVEHEVDAIKDVVVLRHKLLEVKEDVPL